MYFIDSIVGQLLGGEKQFLKFFESRTKVHFILIITLHYIRFYDN